MAIGIDMRDDDEVEAPQRPSMAWMVTFTDMVSLVLTFFVMMFAMSSTKMDQWQYVTDALSRSLNPAKVQPVSSPTAEFNISSIFRKRAVNLDYLASVLVETIARDPALGSARVIRLEDFVIVALPGDLLFPPGRAVLSDSARQALFNLGGVLRNVDNEMIINGHSDPVPPAGDRYADNWELSLGRALAVANALRRSGYTQDIVAHGYSDSRFAELPQLADAGRRTLARRVDIIVMPTVSTLK